jgi:hypothetical protein
LVATLLHPQCSLELIQGGQAHVSRLAGIVVLKLQDQAASLKSRNVGYA